jgi:hypothetical protein
VSAPGGVVVLAGVNWIIMPVPFALIETKTPKIALPRWIQTPSQKCVVIFQGSSFR